MITVHTVSYNEELQIKFLIDHYRSRFTDCEIIVYDNMSTDKTVSIAESYDCKIIYYDTNEQISDSKYLQIKNNCWKSANTDWVLVCDVDELLDINESQLQEEEILGSNIIISEGYNMINMEDNCDLQTINHGVRCFGYDKLYLFNKKFINEINYEAGCHKANPIGIINYSKNSYPAYHFNFINIELSIEKYKIYAERLSPENIKNGWGSHYLFSEDKIREEFADIRSKAIKLL